MGAPGDIARLAKENLAEGYPRLQIKVGGRPVEVDIETIHKVREVVGGTGMRLAVDGNRGWTTCDALRVSREYRPYECWTIGSECDGGFAQFCVAPSQETHAVSCDWEDVELAAIPRAYSTAEGMLHRASVGAESVLITGASGGVSSAVVQLAK